MTAIGDRVATGRWEHFPHDADIGVRGYGATPDEACEQATLAMMAAILDPETVRLEQTVDFALEAPCLDLLLVDWLNALIYEMAERRMVFGAFHVKIENDRLKGRALGEAVSRARHAPAVEVKGATYTELAFVEDRPGLWRAQCVIDV
ncbi:archease [Methylocystis hirsuta]|uniref:Archease n=1 Tax=Methylocystis hirsuta TaxID=369798 RepID=A0A3M9XMW8_9HYPH|nr:archease [Methylocystis hirsuta]RNJ49126.1 archease [Methylocystis hirsuta]